MHRLLHPVRAIREPFGTAGLIVALVALVAALGGTALAAKGALTGKQKKEVEKIAKKFAGKPGPAGPAGPAGAAGAKGDQGPKGDQGVKGDTGGTGPQGPQGPQGVQGQQGSPWTAGGVLPSGKTETGGWSYGFSGDEILIDSISFPIPLAEAPTAETVESPSTTADCKGSATAPTAEPGFLCIYVEHEGGLGPSTVIAETWGATLQLENPIDPSAIGGFGSFAVTAE